jgi:hypothetical protein
MKKNIVTITAIFALIVSTSLQSCKKKVVTNEEEIITTVKLTATDALGNVKTATFADPDGDGGGNPTKFDSLILDKNKVYQTTISVLNESVNPVQDITTEIVKEANDHQFYITTTSAGTTITTIDLDGNGLPLGTKFSITTTTISDGRLQVVLKHKPGTKKAGDAVSVGDTDIELPNGGFYISVK